MAPGTRVIGLGNPDRGDDGAGRAVAQRLRAQNLPNVEIVKRGGEATGLLDSFDGVDAAYLIDASAPNGAPGRIRRFDVAAAPLPQSLFACSTHGLGLAEAVELARTLGRLPGRCIVYTIEAQELRAGAPLSPAVRAAIAETSIRVRNDIAGIARNAGTI